MSPIDEIQKRGKAAVAKFSAATKLLEVSEKETPPKSFEQILKIIGFSNKAAPRT